MLQQIRRATELAADVYYSVNLRLVLQQSAVVVLDDSNNLETVFAPTNFAKLPRVSIRHLTL